MTSSRNGLRWDSYSRGPVEYVSLENSRLRLELCLTVGASARSLRHKPTDVEVLWRGEDEPLHGYVPPSYAGNPFLDHLSLGWQEIFPSGGEADVFGGQPAGKHGEVALLPWSAELNEAPGQLTLRLKVHARRSPFSLERLVTLKSDEAVLRIQETVTNKSPHAQGFMWGHHLAFADPLVSDVLELELPEPFAGIGQGTLTPGAVWPKTVGERTSEFFGQTYVQGQGRYRLSNRQIGIAVVVDWDPQAYPYLWAWRPPLGNDAGSPFFARYPQYLALEPFSSPSLPLSSNVEQGTAHVLEGGAQLHSWMAITLEDVGMGTET